MAAPATSANFMGMKLQLLVEASKAIDAIQFYKTAFGAMEISSLWKLNGRLRIWESDASSARRLMTLRLPSPWL
ncbi:hypothetical protein AB3S75_027549 [Citrus x aurantiifolia]